ncbi:MAG: sirohydrochlorin cobaltochelatase, partial [Oscillospiraceae bacterium]|nr:sirohydrochlorin cobaltochelatase [Oscillospiraceae bacterium]
MKKILALILVLCLVLALCACGAKTEEAAPAAAEAKPVLLAVSFGSSYNETRDATIGAIEAALQEAYPEFDVRRAFTSQIVIDILEEREGQEIDNINEALERLVVDDVKELIVQPTHVMPGFEYDDVMAELNEYADKFDSVKVGMPLISSDADYDVVVKSLVEETAEYNTEGTAIVFMGHGTHHEANATYANLQQKLADAGYANYFIGTVEAAPSLDDVMALVKDSGAEKVVLLPLMIV